MIVPFYSVDKNRGRAPPEFANINLLGKCNVDCYFCLGKDIEEELSKHNNINTHFSQWKNFYSFINTCKENNIKKLYITGQNVDGLQYKYLGQLIHYLQEDEKFLVGVRTNGFLAHKKLDVLNTCKASVGYSIHTLYPHINKKIMDRDHIPDWDNLLRNTKNCRVSIVLNRFNQYEIIPLIEYISTYNNVKYIQVRRICTDTRLDELKEDIELYENVYKHISSTYKKVGEFHTAGVFDMFSKEVNFWRTTQTTVNSFNYFTDGVVSKEYFVVEGYIKNLTEINGGGNEMGW